MVGKVGDEVNTDGVSNWRGPEEIVRMLGERLPR